MGKIKKIISILVVIILIPILFVSVVILANSYIHPNEVPSFFGWKPFIVLSGSMETEIYSGDVAVVKEVNVDELKENDIIAFKTGEIVVTHRIEKVIEENGQMKYITKGDNNKTEDNGYVLPEQVEGKYQFKVSRLGNLAMFAQTPTGIVVCLSIPFICLVLMQITESKKNKQQNENKENDMKKEIEKLKKQNEELMKNTK